METVSFLAPSPAPSLQNVTVSYADVLAHPERYYSGADIAWVMISAALVFLMVPSLSLIYAGLGNRTFALTLFRLPMITCAFIGFQWVLWGYSLGFTTSNLSPSWWGGELRANGLRDALARPVPTGDEPNGPAIPELLYVLYEGMFASFTAALVCGGAMHKVRPVRFLIFISLWSVLVYIPVARWSWDRDGWSNILGTMDFAGGTPVHIVSGTTVAAFAVFYAIEIQPNERDAFKFALKSLKRFSLRYTFGLGKWVYTFFRAIFCCPVPVTSSQDPNDGDKLCEEDEERQLPFAFEPYNVNYLTLGTALLWFGWAGFNGGSALGANLRAVSAWTSTHVAACSGGTMGVLIIWFEKFLVALGRDPNLPPIKDYHSMTVLYFCDGAIAGLVAITPAAGYVPIWSASVFGVVTAYLVHLLKKETQIFLKDDPLCIYAVHAGGGFIGMVLTGIFADPTTIGLDGHSTMPFLERSRGVRVGYQMADACAGVAYTFVMTLFILFFMKSVLWAAENSHIFDRVIRPEPDPQSWWKTTRFTEDFVLNDEPFQATEQQHVVPSQPRLSVEQGLPRSLG